LETEKLYSYIEELILNRTDLLEEMEQYAKAHHVPIMELSGIETILQILRIAQPKKILEVGTAIGYSALRMATVLPETNIVTIERDSERYTVAEEFIKRANKEHQISIIKGDALEVELLIEKFGSFDAVFIDAAKGQYKKFFEIYSKYLADKGIIITDNVLFKGLVCEDTIESKRVRSMVTKIKDFNKWLMEHAEYDSVIIPVGDGVAISKKR
jgi:predicted O-methyltransferase YrrM